MTTNKIIEQIKSLPLEEQKLLVSHLTEHLDFEEDHEVGLYNLDIF